MVVDVGRVLRVIIVDNVLVCVVNDVVVDEDLLNEIHVGNLLVLSDDRLARRQGTSSHIGRVDGICGPPVARRLDMLGVDRVERDLDTAAPADLAGGREGLDEP